MNNNQIHIKIKDGQVSCHTDKPMSIQEFIQATCTCTLGMMQSLVAKAPEGSEQEIKEDLYDMYNAAASNTLRYFAPDIDMRPHLTTQAILEAENNIIKRQSKAAKKAKKDEQSS
jgi:hypothetical protein